MKVGSCVLGCAAGCVAGCVVAVGDGWAGAVDALVAAVLVVLLAAAGSEAAPAALAASVACGGVTGACSPDAGAPGVWLLLLAALRTVTRGAAVSALLISLGALGLPGRMRDWLP